MLRRQTQSGLLAQRVSVIRSAGCHPATRVVSQSKLASRSQRCFVTRQSRPWLRRGLDFCLSHSVHDRALATAVSESSFGALPYNHLSNTNLPSFKQQSPRSPGTRVFDPSTLLTIPEPEFPKSRFAKTNTVGVPGDTEHMLPVFEACIRVGKLERAALVLKRLHTTGDLSGEELILLHNQYLRTSLNQMRTSPDRQRAEQLHKWYEVQIRTQNLPHTAETIACMLKASLLSERSVRLDRLVTRYMGMAPGESGLRVLSMDDILSDQDLAVITEICPTYNYTMDAKETDEVFDTTEADSEHGVAESAAEDSVKSSSNVPPELIPTPQRGEGLSTLKRGMGLLSKLQTTDISKLPYADQREIQMELEQDSITCSIERWRDSRENTLKRGVNPDIHTSSTQNSLSQVVATWLHVFEERWKEELVLIQASEQKSHKSNEDYDRCLYGPLLQQADPARLAAITILAVLNLGALKGADKGLVVTRVISSIAKLLQEDIEMQQQEGTTKENKRLHKLSFISPPASRPTTAKSGSKVIIEESPETADRLKEAKGSWSMTIKAHVGSILLKILLETAKVKATARHPTTEELVSQLQPAFTHAQLCRKGKKVGVLYLNAVLVEKMQTEPIGDFIAKHLPMLVEPKPWTKTNEGGFLLSKTALVRVKAGAREQRLYTKAALRNGCLDQVFKGLDVLGKTSWQINRQVLNVMMESWNSEQEIANMPPLNPQLELPKEPDSSADPIVRINWLRSVKEIENERSALHSQRCFMNLQLEVARMFRNQTIYFPHNVDYRGRAYPMPTYLNHMGADHTRGVLKFARGKELGERGLRWLKIHLANLFGLGKSSFDEREAFANDNMAKIIDSATNPLNGGRWWLEAEDPWQCLAACFDLKAASELPDPTKHVSQLPIHQDGTCNGLQHYAALGGDTWGAKQVNLEPGDRPADVYSAVAELVNKAINQDARDGKNKMAVILQGKISRKVVKQTVMTNVYGVTFSGAKNQVCKQIDALYPELSKETGINHMVLSTYIAKHIFKALATMFRGAHDIQYWLGEVGGRVCRAMTAPQIQRLAENYASGKTETGGEVRKTKKKTKASPNGFNAFADHFRSTVVWTTPLRMPVVQPYRTRQVKEVRTCLQTIAYPVDEQTDPVNRRKQLQGFPPNFIHSLDASHMLLSALDCDKQNLVFAAVHDSFWTHAADVDTMNGILREAFIRIHQEDVIGRLAQEVEARHKGSIYLGYVNSNSAVGKKIKELRKSRNLSARDELFLEHKRNTLRLSGKPEDLEEAKKMITPASLCEDMDQAVDDVSEEDMDGLDLDSMPPKAADSADSMDADSDADLDADLDAESMDISDQMLSVPSGEDGDSASLSDTNTALDPAEYDDFETQIASVKARAAKKRPTRLPLWLPLSLPPVPKKGDFDVERLRHSQYFFS
ncbi:hypothetical protein E4U40_004028 [Claviceps sp. LM458 group G5]|nr:hypothetical protein E4U40_004028 [Claviceps sp. LM458 group G5]